jgi:hypothetical protein
MTPDPQPGVAARLPFIDSHSLEVAAPVEATWKATVAVAASSFRGSGRALFARAIGADPSEPAGEPGGVGSTIVGFTVTEATAPQSLVLEGRHHFSRYRLAFEIRPHVRGSALTAITHAEFPGLKGRAYRALIIGTGLHVVVTNRMLRAIKSRAERNLA